MHAVRIKFRFVPPCSLTRYRRIHWALRITHTTKTPAYISIGTQYTHTNTHKRWRDCADYIRIRAMGTLDPWTWHDNDLSSQSCGTPLINPALLGHPHPPPLSQRHYEDPLTRSSDVFFWLSSGSTGKKVKEWRKEKKRRPVSGEIPFLPFIKPLPYTFFSGSCLLQDRLRVNRAVGRCLCACGVSKSGCVLFFPLFFSSFLSPERPSTRSPSCGKWRGEMKWISNPIN